MRSVAYSPDPNIAAAAALVADPVRAAMLYAVLDGGELPASELAARAGASPQAASAHLARLVEGGFLLARSHGRQRLFRLASPAVGRAMESLAAIAAPVRIRALGQDVAMRRLREARSCYDHLAGRIGVALADRLIELGAIAGGDGTFALGRRGKAFFASLEIDVDALAAQRRTLARACIDWTERRPHVAGALGASLLDRFIRERWVERNPRDRALRITGGGRSALAERFAIQCGSESTSLLGSTGAQR